MSRICDNFVIARKPTFTFKGKTVDPTALPHLTREQMITD
jgi:TolB-like protein